MRLHRLELHNFRGVATRELAFPDTGVTVVLGDNETGKSSLLEAFDLLLELPVESRHARLRDVRPVGRDVPTEVAAEFTLGSGDSAARLHYRKRWFRERLTELRVEHPDGRAESFTDRSAHDQGARLFGAHIDATLWSALVVGQERTLAIPAARELPTVLTALDDVAGEHDNAGVAEQIRHLAEQEYRKYRTATGRPTGELAAEHAEVGRCRVAAADAERRAVDVADDVRRAEQVADERDRLAAELAVMETDLKARQAEHRDIVELRARVDRLRDAAELSVQRSTALQVAQARRLELIADVERCTAAVAEAQDGTAEIAEALAEAESSLEARTAELRTAREKQSEARSDVAELEAQLSVIRDRADLAELDARLEAVEETRAEEARARVAIDQNPVDASTAERAEVAHRAVLTARAAMTAGAPKLDVRRLGESPVRLDDEPLADDAGPLVVERDTVVRVEGAVELTVRPGDGVAALRETLADADETERRLLAELDAENIDAVRTLARARVEAEHVLQAARASVARQLGSLGIDGLRARRTTILERLKESEALETGTETGTESGPGPAASERTADADVIRTRLTKARRGELEVLSELDAAEMWELAARKEYDRAREEKTARSVRIEQAIARHHEVVAALAEARSERSDADLETALTAASEAEEQRAEESAAAERALAEIGADRIEQALADAVAARDRLAARVAALSGDVRQIEGRLEQAGAQGIASVLDRTSAELAHTERRLEILDRRARAASRLRDTLERHRAAAHLRYAAPLRERIDALGARVFGPTFRVVLDEGLAVAARSLHGVQVPVTSLSTGAREQLATIVRLAVAGLTAHDGGGVPVVLDDALGWSDPDRLRAMGGLLASAGAEGQVILLTSVPERYALVPGAEVVRLDGASTRSEPE